MHLISSGGIIASETRLPEKHKGTIYMIISTTILVITDDDDREFMIQLYMDYRYFMYNIAHEIIHDSHIAEDMVSNAICELIDSLPDIRKIDRRKLKSYIAVLVRNDSIDFVRKRKRQSKYTFLPEDGEAVNQIPADGEVDAALIRRAEIMEIKEGLARLYENDRLLLTMKYLEAASDEDIAGKFGIGTSSVRTYLTRARRKLCQLMKEGDHNAQGD